MGDKPTVTTLIVEMVQGSGLEIILDQYGEFYFRPPSEWFRSDASDASDAILASPILTPIQKLKERECRMGSLKSLASLPISFKSQKALSLIAGKFYKIHGVAPSPDAIKNALITVRGAHLNKPRQTFHNRIGVDGRGDWWLDLGDGYAVWYNSEGWTVTDDVQVCFQRHSSHIPMHTPSREGEGDLFSLLDFVNLPNQNSQLLYLVTALQALIPETPKAVLVLVGGHGTFKSTAMNAIIEAFDRNSTGLLNFHKDQNQLIQNLDHHWLAYFDNVSRISEEQSDLLCRGVTGSGAEKRMLYTDDEDVTRRFRRCIGLNGINIVVDKPDLMSRSVVIETLKVAQSQRRTDADVLAEIQRVSPRILGDALTVICRARKLLDEGLEVPKLERMADFTKWGYAITEVLGLPGQFFINAFNENIGESEALVVRSNVVGGVLLDYLENALSPSKPMCKFGGHQLFVTLRLKAKGDGINITQDFPGSPTWLGKAIKEIAPNLPAAGYSCAIKNTNKGTVFVFSLYAPTKLDETSSRLSNKENPWKIEDLRDLRGGFRRDKPVEEKFDVKPVEAVVSEPVGLGFAREAFLRQGELRGDGLELERALEFLGKLGLNASLSAKVIGSMMRDGVIFSPRPGWFRVT